MRRPLPTLLTLLALGVASAAGCSSAEEGESCDAANGNNDCAEGLICRSAFEVQADESVCCPPPPARPSTGACAPAISDFEPDPRVDAAVSTGGSGGSSGSGGSGGAGGSDAGDAATTDAGDAATDAGADASSDATADAAGD